jgi:thioredoxin reductase
MEFCTVKIPIKLASNEPVDNQEGMIYSDALIISVGVKAKDMKVFTDVLNYNGVSYSVTPDDPHDMQPDEIEVIYKEGDDFEEDQY